MDSKSEFPPDDPAVLAFTIELPMTAESFNSKGSEIKAAIAEAAFASAAGDADSSKVAFTGTPKEHSMSKVNDAMCTKPSGVDSSSWREPTFCYTRDMPRPTPAPGLGDSQPTQDEYCKDRCGVGQSTTFEQLRNDPNMRLVDCHDLCRVDGYPGEYAMERDCDESDPSCCRHNKYCRVEIRHQGRWGTICYTDSNTFNTWSDIPDIVCRQAGCFDGSNSDFLHRYQSYEWRGARQYYTGSDPGPWTWMKNVECSGSEARIQDCKHSGFGVHDCGHENDLGVCCAGGCTGSSDVVYLARSDVCDWCDPEQDACAPGEIVEHSGRPVKNYYIANDLCPWSTENECCPRRRRSASKAGRRADATSSDLACSFDLDLGTKDGGNLFVVVDVEVVTTVDEVDDTWGGLNEYNLNQAFWARCLPPVVMTFEPVGAEAEEGSAGPCEWYGYGSSECILDKYLVVMVLGPLVAVILYVITHTHVLQYARAKVKGEPWPPQQVVIGLAGLKGSPANTTTQPPTGPDERQRGQEHSAQTAALGQRPGEPPVVMPLPQPIEAHNSAVAPAEIRSS